MTEGTLEFKGLFTNWLKEAAIEATKKASKSALLYNRAVVKLNQLETPINNLQDLKLIPYIGEKTLQLLLGKLKAHCYERNIPFPNSFDLSYKHPSNTKKNSVNKKRNQSSNDNPKQPKQPRTYIPRHRSGGYAILLALYILDKNMSGVSKTKIIPVASKYCDRSLTANPNSGEFYSAWNGYKSLEKNGLIVVSGRAPKIYALTEEGLELTQKLKQSEGLDSSPLREEVDVSYDNGIRLSPDSIVFDKNNFDQIIETSPLKSKTPNMPQLDESIQPKLSPIVAKPIHNKQDRILNNVDYSIWNYDEYNIKLIVDSREINGTQDRDFFRRQLEILGVECEVMPLTIGDVLWVAKNKVSGREVALNFIGERKRIDDLVSSIIDGRFQEQKNRLLKTKMKHYFYILEERPTDRISDMKVSIQSAISQTMISSRFYVRMFKEIDTVIQFLASATNSIRKHLLDANTKLVVMKPKTINNHIEYSTILDQFRNEFETQSTNYECVFQLQTFIETFSKSDMLTVKEMFIMMLMTIRGVSFEKAITIQNKFPTPKLLLEYFHVTHKDLEEEMKKTLLDKEFAHMVGNKKIGKATLERIYEIWGL